LSWLNLIGIYSPCYEDKYDNSQVFIHGVPLQAAFVQNTGSIPSSCVS
jgi:hypothetical protein